MIALLRLARVPAIVKDELPFLPDLNVKPGVEPSVRMPWVTERLRVPLVELASARVIALPLVEENTIMKVFCAVVTDDERGDRRRES